MKDLRGGIIRLYEQGKTGYEIAKEMKLGSKTVYRIIKRYQETETIMINQEVEDPGLHERRLISEK